MVCDDMWDVVCLLRTIVFGWGLNIKECNIYNGIKIVNVFFEMDRCGRILNLLHCIWGLHNRIFCLFEVVDT